MGGFRKLVARLRRIAVVGITFVVGLAIPARAQLGTPPIILTQPLNVSVPAGTTAIIAATVAPSLTPENFHWYFNGHPLVTNSAVTVSNAVNLALDLISAVVIHSANSSNAGIYSLRITNGVGSAISSNASLTVPSLTITNTLYFVTSGIGLSVSGFHIQLSGPPGSNIVIQASTNLKNWASISTNPAPAGSVSYMDTSAKSNSIRYYRAFVQ